MARLPLLQVCSGATGHVEVYELEYVGGDVAYEQLVRWFFQFHDPTTLNSQGNDQGEQYASVIYCYSDAQVGLGGAGEGKARALLGAEATYDTCL
jgi:peptide-methionine (S)-S-oxide reductase